ncbi:MAG: HD domain-containing protein [Chloroflexota bacterium]
MAKKNKKDWKAACRYEMRKAALKEAKAKTGNKDPAFIYRLEHVKAVVKQARKLARLTGADEDIVVAAAWLHDVKKFEDSARHAELGAEFAKKFLKETDFPKKKINAVSDAIRVHAGLWRDEPLEHLEAQVLWDADKLTKVGLTAIFHWIPGNVARMDKSFTTEDFVKGGHENDWQDKTVASFHTEHARRAGKARLKSFRKLWHKLEAELKAADLK